MTSNRKPNTSKKSDQGRVWLGVIILLIGVGLLAPQLGFKHLVPSWIVSWPMWLVVIGLVIGGNSNFKNPSAIILIGLGAIFLIQREYDYNIWRLAFPVAIIAVGLYLLLYKRGGQNIPPPDHRPGQSAAWTHTDTPSAESPTTHYPRFEHDAGEPSASEEPLDQDARHMGSAKDERRRKGASLEDSYFSSTAIFSEEKMIITSRNLQGGEVVNVFGGTDLNLLHADIEGPVVIDLFQLFAGTKIIVPAHWKVHSDVVSIFGEVDDRRFYQDPGRNDKKIIHLKGTSIFGGVTIKSM